MGDGTFRADQVGSLLRPRELLQARARYIGGGPALHDAEDQAILEVLSRQRELGIDVVVDGEFRRASWQTDMADAVEGFVDDKVEMEWHGEEDVVEGSSAKVVGGSLRQRQRLTEHESGFLHDHAGGPFKITVPSPSVFMIMSFKPGLTDQYYPTRGDLLEALVDIVRAEVEALLAEGVPYIQLDAPQYSYYFDEKLREKLRGEGADPDEALTAAIDADNRCLDAVAHSSTVTGMHICRGNRRSMSFARGGYEPIAEQLFSTCTADRLLLEYDTDNAGGFEPLRFVPDDKYVVLGLLTTKAGALESRDDLLRRIDEATAYHPVDRLALSPQCGFASNSAGNHLSTDEQWAKLARVTEVAREVWPE